MALYSIVTRAPGTGITGTGTLAAAVATFNFDHLNHVTNYTTSETNGDSDTVALMRVTDDAAAGLAQSIADELEQVRFTLQQVKQALNAGVAPAFWYTPTVSFASALLPAVAARLDGSTTIIPSTTALTPLVFTTTTYDGPMGTLITSGRLGFTAPVTAKYILGFTVGDLGGVGGTFRQAEIHTFDGTSTRVIAQRHWVMEDSESVFFNAEVEVQLVAGMTATVHVAQDSGSNKVAGSSIFYCHLVTQ